MAGPAAVMSVLASAGISAAAALSVGLPGLLLLRWARRRSLAVLLSVVVLTGAVSVTAGVVASSLAMFTTAHDVAVLLPVLAVAGLVSVAGGLLVARWVGGAGRQLVAALESGDRTAAATLAGPAEMQLLGSALLAERDRLVLSRAREQALEGSRRELVAWVSHDLRTPLAGLRAMAEALEDGVVSDAETVQRYHSLMRREVDRLSGLVDDLFELSRIHAGAVRNAVSRIGAGDLVSDALASADPLARGKRVHLSGVGAEALPPVEVSVPEVGRALRNLLTNAIRHTPSDGAVVVAGHSDEDSVYLAVHDSCGGIPEEDLPRVFDVAFRGQVARTPTD
ncbi:MAG TPA: histidine kinase dimerization/phospho-acceptor domain-containing protein, partial [Mycobacteriales bacterium]|nr:histidine kinase dimerization/phospho-acceptor domain-containing protein [Mycobacteriales bacterium]